MYSGLLSSLSTTKEKQIWGLFELEKKLKLREPKQQVGERAEQLEQADTKCCQILYNLNLRGHFSFKFEKYWLYAQGKFLYMIEMKCKWSYMVPAV